MPAPTIKKYRQRCARLQTKVNKLEDEIAKYTSPQAKSGRVSIAWILRAFLASPHASGRALASSFRVVTGLDSTTVSRSTIMKIKAAWVEMFTCMVFNVCRKFVDAHVLSCKRNRRPFVVLTVTHIQDEADIRLRSGEARDGPKMPRRARASKVQMHVVTLAAGLFKRETPHRAGRAGGQNRRHVGDGVGRHVL